MRKLLEEIEYACVYVIDAGASAHYMGYTLAVDFSDPVKSVQGSDCEFVDGRHGGRWYSGPLQRRRICGNSYNDTEHRHWGCGWQ